MQPIVVALDSTHLVQVEAHLLRLNPDDRSLRFAAGLVTDDTIRRYCARIPFRRDAVFGLSQADGTLIGLAHGCVYDAHGGLCIEAAFSVDAGWRGQGLGSRLMHAVAQHARAIGAVSLVGLCAARNLPMRRVFERAGMTLTREDDEIHAERALHLQPAVLTRESALAPI